MGNNWGKILAKVEEMNQETPKGRSQAKSLRDIIAKAEIWEIDPEIAEKATMSNLTEIISEANTAVRGGNKERLEELFIWASQLRNIDLRNRLRGDKLNIIAVERVRNEDGLGFALQMTQEQFNRMATAMRRYFTFMIKEKSI